MGSERDLSLQKYELFLVLQNFSCVIFKLEKNSNSISVQKSYFTGYFRVLTRICSAKLQFLFCDFTSLHYIELELLTAKPGRIKLLSKYGFLFLREVHVLMHPDF
jgi:hypothetical protein